MAAGHLHGQKSPRRQPGSPVRPARLRNDSIRANRMLGTLAAAYAEAGKFDDAIAAAQRACDLAEKNGEPICCKRTGNCWFCIATTGRITGLLIRIKKNRPPTTIFRATPKKPAPMRRDLFICLLLAGITLAIYWPARNFDLYRVDDQVFLTETRKSRAA